MANTLDVLSKLSPDQRKALDKQNELSAGLYAPGQSLAQMRAGYEQERRFWNEGGPVPFSVEDRSVTTAYGQVTCRLYRPTDSQDLPVIVYIHGGGWVLGSLDTHDRICRTLCVESGAAVVSVGYSLSPEAKYPQPVEECAAVVQELRAQPGRWGIDPDDISLAGDSGGANMSFGVFLYLREAGRKAGRAVAGIRCLLLIYGWYGLRDSVSSRLLGGPWDGLTRADFFDLYLGRYLRGPEDVTAPFVDILGQDLTTGLPPLYLAAAELDPLRDDSQALAVICENFGIPYHFELVPGVLHGFIHHSRLVPAAAQVLSDAARFFQQDRAAG